ncbi:MAG: biotin carboxylase, partial [Candidatus Marinimicrobia bacterium]|nr:biotin carboxylase [Candidatus Neomarinimicrobiota bacterium]
MLKKVLIANRGEIAVRVIRSCRELGITTVAVYSQADRTSPHVLLADEALCIGPPPAKESYLDMDAILAAARKSGADAIHPGYGFLSENAIFAKAVQAAGLVWIGPDPDTILKMGDKVVARRLALDAGAPIVPGGAEPLADIKEARKLALQVGYPVLVKAAGGGGGKGMRLVQEPGQLDAAVERAR